MEQWYVYLLASKKGGILYTGVTGDLPRRVGEHKEKYVSSFSKRYNIVHLVYYEVFSDPESAIQREKRIKKWYRKWKIALIEKNNPEWNDLYETLF